jgi:hypothetical protein
VPQISTPPAPVPAPTLADNGVQGAAIDSKKKAAAAVGAAQTNVTGPQGLVTPASTSSAGKTLLGG